MHMKILQLMKQNSIQLIDAVKYFYPPRKYCEVFFDRVHYLKSGNQLVAQAILDGLDECINKKSYNITDIKKKKNKKILTSYCRSIDKIIEKKYKSEIYDYINSIKKYNCSTMVSGAIIVNCNPFTYEHLKIIEFAATKVDLLYIFVVEADYSYFSFKDRFF